MRPIDMGQRKSPRNVAWATARGRVCGVVLAAACATAPAEAQAEAPHYRLDFSVSKGLSATCGAGEEFEGLLDVLLAEPLLDPPASRVLTINLGRTPTGAYAADLVFKDLDGHVLATVHHEYPASNCCFRVLYDLATAASIHMQHREDLPEAPPPPAAPSAPCPSGPPPAAPPPTSPAPAAPPPREPLPAPRLAAPRPWFIGLGGVFAIGIAPELVGGLQAVGGRRWDRWSLEVDARYTFPTETRPAALTVVEIQTFSAALAPCLRLGAFGVCALALGGITIGEAARKYPVQDRMGLLGLGLRGLLELRFTDRWTARLDAEAAVPFMQSRFNARVPRVWTASPVNATFGAGVFVSF
jgi:hypothetical protein